MILIKHSTLQIPTHQKHHSNQERETIDLIYHFFFTLLKKYIKNETHLIFFQNIITLKAELQIMQAHLTPAYLSLHSRN